MNALSQSCLHLSSVSRCESVKIGDCHFCVQILLNSLLDTHGGVEANRLVPRDFGRVTDSDHRGRLLDPHAAVTASWRLDGRLVRDRGQICLGVRAQVAIQVAYVVKAAKYSSFPAFLRFWLHSSKGYFLRCDLQLNWRSALPQQVLIKTASALDTPRQGLGWQINTQKLWQRVMTLEGGRQRFRSQVLVVSLGKVVKLRLVVTAELNRDSGFTRVRSHSVGLHV